MGKRNLENLKLKVASEVGVNLKEGYNGNITSRQAGLIGGNMVRQLITQAQHNLIKTQTSSQTVRPFNNPTSTNML